MADLSQYSDDELLQMLGQPPRKKKQDTSPLADVSTDDLLRAVGIPSMQAAPVNPQEDVTPATQPGQYVMGGPQGTVARAAEATLGYAPTALRVAGGLLPQIGAGGAGEYLARAAEVGTGQRAPSEMTDNLGRAMLAQEAVNRIIPKPAQSLTGAVATGLGTGAAVSTVAPLIEHGQLPSLPQLGVGTLLGGLLGGGGYKIGQILQDRAATQQLASELSDRLGREVPAHPDAVTAALDEVHGMEAGAAQALFPPPDVTPNVGPLPPRPMAPPPPPAPEIPANAGAALFPTPGLQPTPEALAAQAQREQLLANVQRGMTTQAPELPAQPIPGVAQTGTALGKLPGGEVLPPVQELMQTPQLPDQSLLSLAQRGITSTPGEAPPIESGTAKTLRMALETLQSQRGAVGKVIPPPEEDLARKMFGLTRDPNEAGFLLSDGSMLDFSGKSRGGRPGHRDIDHSEIQFADINKEAVVAGTYSPRASMRQFMDTTGAVRMSSFPGVLNVDIGKPLTPAQGRVLTGLVDTADEVNIDWTDAAGRTQDTKNFTILSARDRGQVKRLIRDQIQKPSTLRETLQNEQGAITLRSGAIPPLKSDIESLANRLVQQGIPQDEAVQQAGNIRLDKALEGLPDTEQLRRLQQEIIQSNLPLMDYARRGVRPQDVTQEAALKLGMTEETLLKRARGQSLNAEQILAAGYVADRSALKLQGVLQAAQQGQANIGDFTQALAQHVMVMEHYSGSVAEAGRTLNILRQAREGRIAAQQVINDLFHSQTLPEDIQAKLAETMRMNPGAFNKTIEDMRQATTADKLYEVWINGLLSGPQTHAVNFVSNALADVWRTVETGVSGVVDAMQTSTVGGPRERYAGEALADVHGQLMGMNDALRGTWAYVRTLPEGPVKAAQSFADVFQANVPSEFTARKFEFRPAIEGRLGQAVRMPGAALDLTDRFWNTIESRGALQAQAYRQALQEGLSGTERTQRIAQLVANPTDALKTAASKEAMLRTFRQEPGPSTAAFMRFRNLTPGARYIIPFVNTSMNIAKFAVERTPLALVSLGWNSELRRALAAGGGERSDAIARVLLGSSALALGAYLAANGVITGGGPTDAAERKAWMTAGNQPYAAKVNGQNISFGRLEPVTSLFGLGADFADVYQKYALEGEDAAAALSLAAAFQKNFLSKTYVKGPSDFLEMLNDTEQYGQQWIESTLKSTIPTGIAALTQAIDPIRRAPQGIEESLQTRIPGQSQKIPPLRDIWGQPVIAVGTWPELLFSPLRRTIDPNDFPTHELLRLQPIAEEQGIHMLPGSPAKQLTIKGQKLEMTRQEYDAYVEASGKLARSIWESVVSSPNYQQIPDQAKVKLADETFTRAREAARKMTLVGVIQNRPQSLRELFEKGIQVPTP